MTEKKPSRAEGARGQCQDCGYRVRLLKSGDAGWHWIYVGDEKRQCTGTYHHPKPRTTKKSRAPLAKLPDADRGRG